MAAGRIGSAPDMAIRKAPGSQDAGTAPIINGSSPRHEAVAQSELDLTQKFELDLTYRYVSALPGQSIPGYSTGDAVIALRVRPELEVAAVGRDLHQPWHLEFGNDTGRRWGLGGPRICGLLDEVR